ncbi:hypothetical protein [Halobacterium litoreum]|uniref:DUF6199 domain-containing protein n=1 Tax=Halobacterium litoreum TaxID=2039234 RepID=A0ABD5NG76_9EURY|nr:hypothetical protein [Halobacterium litoreum]UHH12937.1 hypothetical protein LT972_12320 [Halobacterium litoreum]
MSGIRELLAVVLGVGLGVALLAKPREMLMLSVFVGPNRRRRHDGRYGTDDHPFGDWAAWLVRAAGVACIAVAGFIAYQNF